MKCIQREINFLRELVMCENVITLEKVYKSDKEDEVHLVLRYAQHGSMLRMIAESNAGLEEEVIRKVIV